MSLKFERKSEKRHQFVWWTSETPVIEFTFNNSFYFFCDFFLVFWVVGKAQHTPKLRAAYVHTTSSKEFSHKLKNLSVLQGKISWIQVKYSSFQCPENITVLLTLNEEPAISVSDFILFRNSSMKSRMSLSSKAFL